MRPFPEVIIGGGLLATTLDKAFPPDSAFYLPSGLNGDSRVGRFLPFSSDWILMRFNV